MSMSLASFTNKPRRFFWFLFITYISFTLSCPFKVETCLKIILRINFWKLNPCAYIFHTDIWEPIAPFKATSEKGKSYGVVNYIFVLSCNVKMCLYVAPIPSVHTLCFSLIWGKLSSTFLCCQSFLWRTFQGTRCFHLSGFSDLVLSEWT